MNNISAASSRFFKSLERKERTGKIIFLSLASLATIIAAIVAFTDLKAVSTLPFLSFAFLRDTESSYLLTEKLIVATTVATLLLQTALFIIAYCGKNWAKIILAVHFALNSFLAASFLISALIEGAEILQTVGLFVILSYCLTCCVVMLKSKSIKEFMYYSGTK